MTSLSDQPCRIGSDLTPGRAGATPAERRCWGRCKHTDRTTSLVVLELRTSPPRLLRTYVVAANRSIPKVETPSVLGTLRLLVRLGGMCNLLTSKSAQRAKSTKQMPMLHSVYIVPIFCTCVSFEVFAMAFLSDTAECAECGNVMRVRSCT